MSLPYVTSCHRKHLLKHNILTKYTSHACIAENRSAKLQVFTSITHHRAPFVVCTQIIMYPTVPGAHDAPHTAFSYETNSMPSNPHYPPSAAAGASNLGSAHSLDNPWGADSSSILHVKIADDYKLDPPVPVPPALAASTKPQQEFDYDYERKVMSNDASTSLDAFLAKPETSYYDNTKAGRFIRGGFSPAIVNLALAYHASNRGDESQIMQFCANLKTLTQDMSFALSLAAGALVQSNNDLSAAANLCTELS